MRAWELTRTFESEQGTIRWDRFGEADAASPPILLLHGTPFSSFIWRDVAPALALRSTVYVWDLAGYGASAQADGQDVSLAAQARILASLLDHWGLEEPDVVGHDFGGAIALRGLLLEGCRYRRLVLADAVSVAPWGTGFFQLAKEYAEVLQRLPDPVHDGLVRGYVQWAASKPLDPEVVDGLVGPWAGEHGKAALYRQIAQNDQRWTDDLEPRYGELDLPVRILWGAEDAWLPLEQAHQLHAAIPGSELTVIPEAGHLVPLDAPATVAAEVASFLAG